jgi:hypothetical protein
MNFAFGAIHQRFSLGFFGLRDDGLRFVAPEEAIQFNPLTADFADDFSVLVRRRMGIISHRRTRSGGTTRFFLLRMS